VGFINKELSLLKKNKWGKIEDHCIITDSLKMARKTYPGQRNSLNALCKRLGIDNANRTLHGALLDSEILADVYLTMTGGQTALSLNSDSAENDGYNAATSLANSQNRKPLRVLMADQNELSRHQAKLTEISGKADQEISW
jgi:DNA polymerase-3 subunit epsilon